MLRKYSKADLRTLDTEELRAILEECVDQPDDEFDYSYVKSITDILVERDPDPNISAYMKQAHEIFWREYAHTTPLFEDVINEFKDSAQSK